MKQWKRLLSYLRPYPGRLTIAVIAMVFLAFTTGLYPILLDLLTTLLMEGEQAAQAALAAKLGAVARLVAFFGGSLDPASWAGRVRDAVLWFFGGVVAIKAVSQAARFYFMGSVAQRVIRDLRAQIFDSMLAHGPAFFGEQGMGHLVSKLVNDVTQVERAATYAIPVLVGDVLKVVALALVCAVQYPRLALVSLIAVPLAVLPIVQFGRMLKRYGKRGQQELGSLTNRITETLGGVTVVQTYGQEEYESARFADSAEGYLSVMMKSVLVRAVQTPAMELVGVLALLLTLGYAVNQTGSNQIRPGEVVGFLLALVLIYEPLKAIGRLNAIVMPGLSAAERVFEIIDRPPDIEEDPHPARLAGPPSVVRFDGVGFRYRPELGPALHAFDLELRRGQVVALVGPSGGGKSTVAKLLPRLYDVTDGAIKLDDTDVRRISLAELRSQIAMVAQETYLFNDTVRANIAYGDHRAEDADVQLAADQAGATEFIAQLDGGLDALVGERGGQLSGGQRQRIAIARAFLRDAPILILDEATSALDSDSERTVQAALDRLMENRTTLVIAHRLSTIRRADLIVVLDQGRIVEQGAHEELLAAGGHYARLVDSGEVDACT